MKITPVVQNKQRGDVMKQHISREQLYKLESEQFIELYRFVRPHSMMTNETIKWYFKENQCNGVIQDINIGKMIEFIQVNTENFGIRPEWVMDENPWGERVKGFRVGFTTRKNSKWFEQRELADALWQAMKFILEEEVC